MLDNIKFDYQVDALTKDFKGFWYLASPYTHHDPNIVEQRVEEVHDAMGWLMSNGLFVMSPIYLCHAAAICREMPTDFKWWWGFNESFMSKSCGMIVLQLEGWKESRGVAAEIEYYKENNKPYFFLDPRDVPALS